jgi:hypothetical protein
MAKLTAGRKRPGQEWLVRANSVNREWDRAAEVSNLHGNESRKRVYRNGTYPNPYLSIGLAKKFVGAGVVRMATRRTGEGRTGSLTPRGSALEGSGRVPALIIRLPCARFTCRLNNLGYPPSGNDAVSGDDPHEILSGLERSLGSFAKPIPKHSST